MQDKSIHQISSGLFAPIAGSFVMEAIEHMIPWLITMFFVILCDLATGCRKSLMMGEHVRFSRAWRATMGKMVTYFSFVIMVVMINEASGGRYNIDIFACLSVCFIEGCSIISNILKPKGYDFNLIVAIEVFAKKVFGIDKEDSEGIVTKRKRKRVNENKEERV